ncbi:response regulator transcription factor [Enterococcus sp. DIV0086]|uniref:response regulator transcription factor n=1 Tax=Enterococcus sp. DIV0086 TaxID=2774655 RepID=UPI003D2ADABE
MKTILLVEDDESLLEVTYSFLTASGYNVLTANNGIQGYEQFKNNEIDLLITDIMMPKLNGYALVELIQMEQKHIPIFMLTALSGEEDELKGLELGINDYIQKPFSYKVFLKRIENILNNDHEKPIIEEILTCGNIQIFPESYIVLENNKQVSLTKKEFEILVVLIRRKNKTVSRQKIIELVWGYSDEIDTTMLNSHLKNLRQKLNSGTIQTVRGVGYKISELF